MTNKEKLIAIIGEENFRKLERNFNPDYRHFSDIDQLVDVKGRCFLTWAFLWRISPEGHNFWHHLYFEIYERWDNFGPRLISPEEHDLIFKMFVMEWMEYPQGDNERWYETVFSEGVGLKVYEALRSE